MMKFMKTILLFAVFLTMLTSCACDEISDNREKLTGIWKLTDAVADPSLIDTTETGQLFGHLFENLDACYKDNVLTFDGDGLFILDEGAIKCDSTSSQVMNGTWVFKDDESIISMRLSNGVTDRLNIINLTDHILTVFGVTDNGLVNQDITWTYTKQ